MYVCIYSYYVLILFDTLDHKLQSSLRIPFHIGMWSLTKKQLLPLDAEVRSLLHVTCLSRSETKST
jgi:hypothetical protein